jgi:RNA polymerase sigma-70 factor (ECF subfamily)
MDKLARDKEEQLITRSQQGDVDAFNQLVLLYQQFVYNTVFRLLGDYDAASDITQDTFIAAFRAIRSYRGGSSFRAWLLRIGTNLTHDHWRRLQRRPTSSLDEIEEEEKPYTISRLQSLASAKLSENPEEYILTRELQELLQQGLARLTLEQRTALILCDIQGLAYEEVAQITQTTLGTVRSRISRGRSHLRDYLNGHKELLPRNYRLSNKTD